MSPKAALCVWRINNENNKLEVLLTQRRWSRWGMYQFLYDVIDCKDPENYGPTFHRRCAFMTRNERDLLIDHPEELWNNPMIPLSIRGHRNFSREAFFRLQRIAKRYNEENNGDPRMQDQGRLSYTFPGGKPNAGEGPCEAALREFVEETGIERSDILPESMKQALEIKDKITFFIGQLKNDCQANQVQLWETNNAETSRCFWASAGEVHYSLEQLNPENGFPFQELSHWAQTRKYLKNEWFNIHTQPELGGEWRSSF